MDPRHFIIGVVIIVVLFILWYLYALTRVSSVAHYTSVPKGYVAHMNTKIPSLSKDVYSRFCSCGSESCGRPADAAKDALDRQKAKKEALTIGGKGLKRKIRNGNKRPELYAAHLANPQSDAEDGGDYLEYAKNKSINPEVKDTHKLYLSERKMYSQQPAIPSDVIESNYGNFWGLGRRTFRAPSVDARQQYGANDEDYDPKWGSTYSFS